MAEAHSYEQICYRVFSGEAPHADAATLLQLVGKASSTGAIPREEIPQSEWLLSELCALGFVEEKSVLLAPEGLCSALIKQQNQARARVHEEAASRREALLSSLLTQPGQPQVDLGSARDSLRCFAHEWGEAVAAGPLFLGIGALLRSQASHPTALQVWALSRATVLNGGDEFCCPAITTLRALGLRPTHHSLERMEEGAGSEDMAWVV
ncbi:MAG: hypothetical protein SGPRY_011688 [Prymnesium sp.]